MRFQKSQPAGAATLVPHSASTGPLKNMDASSPARKAHAHEMHQKAGSISNTCELPWPVRGDMKQGPTSHFTTARQTTTNDDDTIEIL
jgi:hypothetical protein